MARNKTSMRQARSGASTSGPACSQCETPTVDGARYCHHCGASLDGSSRGTDRRSQIIVLAAALVIVLAITIGGAVVLFEGPPQVVSVPPPAAPVQQALPPAPAGNQSERPPDLSSMTPREAADRLFNRVMSAGERGDTAEVQRFAPMTIQAYELVRDIDLDGLYHLGLVHLALNDLDAARRRAAAIKQAVPGHLLATTLEHTVAGRIGDQSAMARAVADFAKAYETEMLKNRPEYTAHRNSIEAFRAANPAR